MKITTVHRVTFCAKCPNGCDDAYDAEFHVGPRVVMVEDIEKAIKTATSEPRTQEAITANLAVLLNCQVSTYGTHGRFSTNCVVGVTPGAES